MVSVREASARSVPQILSGEVARIVFRIVSTASGLISKLFGGENGL